MSVVSCKPFPCNFSPNFLSAVNILSYSCAVCKAEAGNACLSWTWLHLVAIILYILYSRFLKSWICFLFECHKYFKTQTLVSGSQSQLNLELRQLHLCHLCRAKDMSSRRWDELWVLATGSVRRLIRAGDSPAGRLMCASVRLLPQIKASHDLLILHASHLPVPKYFKVLKEKTLLHPLDIWWYSKRIPMKVFHYFYYSVRCIICNSLTLCSALSNWSSEY